ncbi:TerD family protein [Streptomyces sp. HPF1205]|uniref:TerD family protein n=1 Tax=Streptomyces sp. HPF1205 TaxID=2873262 RepID=UPI001CECF075|nr:TerD family protein [Streptomyces sp. HPF1205]
MGHRLDPLVIRHTLRVPRPAGPRGDGSVAARQFDAALMSVGFKLSAQLLRHLSGLSEGTVADTAAGTLDAVREMVGDHVRHNAYFIDFPANVPDTFDFWMQCISGALADDRTHASTLRQLSNGLVDLLTLPSYGNYGHTYAEMLARHDELTAAAGDRITVLHLGGTSQDELHALYLALAGSSTPLGDDGLRDLQDLAGHCAQGPQPEEIPVRENRAVVNQARLTAGADPLLDTVTDVLRLACGLAGGDVTLREPTRLRALPRAIRRALLAGLDAVVTAAPAKLADVHAHREMWKRLGERLHPHEYPQWPHAAEVFAVARGEMPAPSLDSRVEELLAARDVTGAAELLKAAPGKLFRSLDQLLRDALTQDERDAVMARAEQVVSGVSGRVVLSVLEHLHNRAERTGRRRVFVNRLGRAWVTDDTRPPVPAPERKRLIAALEAELRRRLPTTGRLLIDPDILDVALPLSGKATASGLGVLPRGSVSPVDGELLRFFVYWKQTELRTDFDLSALLLKGDYSTHSWLSYTNLRNVEGEHSGDITDAPDGASEFINLRLGAVRAKYIVPQVNIYAGEGFEEVEESFFGFMLREAEQKGRPFEPRTVRMKSELRGPGRVALPLVFLRGPDGRWRAKWLHLYLKGTPTSNRVESSQVTVAVLLRDIVEHEPLTIRHLIGLMSGSTTTVTEWDGRTVPVDPVTYIGLERPDGLHPQSRIITLENLRDLIPA